MPTIYEECARLVTRNDHLDAETEGSLTPAQAANDSPASIADLAIAHADTVFALDRARKFTARLNARLQSISNGTIPEMPTYENTMPLPNHLRWKP